MCGKSGAKSDRVVRPEEVLGLAIMCNSTQALPLFKNPFEEPNCNKSNITEKVS